MTMGTQPAALITGACSGVGKAFALRLLSEGYIVYGAARRIERMQDIAAAGGVALAMDVTNDLTSHKAIMRLIEALGVDACEAGSLAESWRQQSEQPAYCTDATRAELHSLLARADRE